ncbi:MAG: acetylglutamate kinase [Syntrophomonadaceae bacterium]|nr:acetylglutamate kinase [Syntrophomonadaceae bacterium]
MMQALEKAGILVEALPYIKQFYGKTIVLKYGGHAMKDQELKQAMMTDIVLMKYVGINPVLVHGGGPEINLLLERLGINSSFIQGLRVTDRETMEVVEMVLVGKVNKEIVSLINRHGGRAVGFSGKDGNLIEAQKKILVPLNGEEEMTYELGYVGEVARINPEIIQTVVDKGYIPVVAPIGVGLDGESYNINADYVAGAMAAALKADKLILLTDVEGIYGQYGDDTTLLSSIQLEEIPSLIHQGVITGGMIPKVQCCSQALQGGVVSAHIIDGRIPHSVLLEIFTDQGVGTMVSR